MAPFTPRTHFEIDLMVRRISSIRDNVPEEKGYKYILEQFISDLLNYPKEKPVYDETSQWIAHKPELLEDYLLGVESLTKFVEDVKREGIVFGENDIYDEECPAAKKIALLYHISYRSKAIYFLAFLVTNKIATKQDAVYIVEPDPKNDFEY